MAIETNLNQSPYFDDFSEDKNFHRVLFRPGYSVQARELTQLQTILQNQIERFANEVVVDGTIITGVGVTTSEVQYVKLRDTANSNVVLLSSFFSGSKIANAVVTGQTSGVTAKLVDAKEGSEAGAPNYLSVFVDYTNSGSNSATQTFADNEELIFRNSSDNSFIVVANTIASSSTGKGFRASVTDGIIYHKGNFIRVEPQSIIVDKYTTTPNRKLGFTTTESIVDSNQDSSLLDNSTGSTNFAAPGANRLKLNPTLAVRNLTSANTTTFFTIARIENGQIAQKFTDTTYSDIGNYISNRNYETNGNYAIEPFNLRIREHLKATNNLGRYTSANGGDGDKIVCETEKGIGYVSGNRIAVESSIFNDVDKATAYNVKTGRAIGQVMGNYVIVDDVVGPWNFNQFHEVKLMASAQNAISRITAGLSSPIGSASGIGTAKVRGFQWHSGTAGTPTGKFRVYLFDIQMSDGYSFSDVRGLYRNNASGPDSFADIVLDSGVAKIQEPGLNTLVFPFSQPGTKTIKDGDNNVNTTFVYRNTANAAIGTDGTATITADAAKVGGTESMNYVGNPIGNIRERDIVIVSAEASESNAKTGTISSISGTTVNGSSTEFETDYRVGDYININGTTHRIASITNDTTLTIANTASNDSGSHKAVFPVGHIWDLSSNGTITTTSSQIQVDLQADFAAEFDTIVYFDTKRDSAVQTAKTVKKNYYVHINTGSHSASKTGPWTLGVPDAYKISAVYSGTNTSVTTSDTDVTSHFELDTGMKDAFYGLSYLKKKSTSSLDLTNKGLLVKFDYFGRDVSQGRGYLSVDSYPVNDANPLATTTITTSEIPVFTSPTTGKEYDLRDSIDFRPAVANTCAPTQTGTVAGTATNPSATYSINVAAGGSHIISPDKTFECDLQYYLPRKDRVVLTAEGNVEVIKGVPALTPKTPDEIAGSMTLGVLNIPVYPSLSPYVSKQYERPDYAVTIDLENNRRYTMKDLRAIENRIKNLEYYSSLNSLEASAKNKQIFGSSGLDRFKNGFFVDNFDGHNNADRGKVGYRASIDRNNALLRPTFNRVDVPLALDKSYTSSGVTQTGNLITLSYANTSFSSQPYASKLRNPVQELTFNWTGEVILDPPIDNVGDTVTLPDIQIDFDGMYSAIQDIAQRTGITGIDWGNWRTTSSSSTGWSGGWGWQNRTTQEQQIRNGIQTFVSPSTESFSIGNFVENVAVRSYMRSRLINFTGTRMKPNTRVWPYFDDELVADYCTPANSSFANTAVEGSSLTTDSSGNVYGVFRIPNDDELKFRVGTRRFELKDISDTFTQADLITTSAHGDYTSIGLDVTQRGTNINMAVPQIATRNVTDSRRLTSTQWRNVGWPDPLTQSFTVNAGDSDGVFITKLDLFFGKKSSTYPITVQIREMDNGFPTSTIVPYGSKTIQPSSVNASTASAATATTFGFDSPVYLKNNTDYCFVVIPGGNSDDYALWVGQMGGTDVDNGELIDKQPATGIMFSSADNKTWSPIQDEDIKYTLHKATFGSSGTVYVENADMNFFTLDNFNGTFNTDEKVRFESLVAIHGVSGNTAGNYLQVGDVLANTSASANGTVREIVQEYANGTVIVRVDPYGSDNWTSLATSNNTVNIYGDNFTSGAAQVNSVSISTNSGFVRYIDSLNGKMYIDGVTNNSSAPWANGYVRGQVSGASARITSVDNVVLNTLVPKIPQITYGNTASSWVAKTTTTGGSIMANFTDAVDIDLGIDNDFLDGEKKIFSYTNEQSLSADDNSSKKSLVLKGSFTSTDTNVSPVIDITRANGLAIENIIGSNTATYMGETAEVGDASMRYISKPVELADGQDAEDLKVFLTSYKPNGTQIKVFARIHNPEDAEGFDDKDYSPLTQITSANTYSDSVDRNDFVEFEYGFSANTDGQNFLGSATDNIARLNSANNDVVTYRASDGSIHATYKTFSIKIVMTSDGTNQVPLVKDMRAIALQK